MHPLLSKNVPLDFMIREYKMGTFLGVVICSRYWAVSGMGRPEGGGTVEVAAVGGVVGGGLADAAVGDHRCGGGGREWAGGGQRE